MGRKNEAPFDAGVAVMAGRLLLSLALFLGLAHAAPAGDFGGKTAGEWLKLLREDKNPKVRSIAVLALSTIGPKVTGVTTGLLDALREDPEPEIRREIALQVGRLATDIKGATEALGDRLVNDKNELVRQAAATALGGKLAEKAEGQVSNLVKALKDKHEGVRRAAAETLKNMGEKAKPAVPALIEVAKDPSGDRFTRIYAITVIGQWGKENKGTGPALAVVIVEKDAHITVRQAAAEGLGRLGGDFPPGIEALGKGLLDGPPELRRSVAITLGQVGKHAGPAWPAIKATLQDKKSDSTTRFALIRAAASVAKEHADAVGELLKLAEFDDAVENRLAAIQELGELGAVAAAAAKDLQRIAGNDARAAIREAAAAAHKKITGS
jgi:HEAT repeat protein